MAKYDLFNTPNELVDIARKITERKDQKSKDDARYPDAPQNDQVDVPEDHMPDDEILYTLAKKTGREKPGVHDDGVDESQFKVDPRYDGKKVADNKGLAEEFILIETKVSQLHPSQRSQAKQLLRKAKSDESVILDLMTDKLKIVKKKELSDYEHAEIREAMAEPEDNEDESPLEPEEDDDYPNKDHAAKSHGGDPQMGEDEDKEEEMKDKDKLDESYASQEPASAVGQRRKPELPKHVDVVHDYSRYSEGHGMGFRLLATFPNSRPELFPSANESAANSKEELMSICPPEWFECCGEALELAFASLKDDPHYSGGEIPGAKDAPNVSVGLPEEKKLPTFKDKFGKK